MNAIRVLVVDDSAFMRKVIREMLQKSSEIEVVGSASSGEIAIELIPELHPDVVTVDLFMSEMNGEDFIRKQMDLQPIPIVVCSSAEESGRSMLSAMDAGAVEFVRKPTAMALEKMYNIENELIDAVKAASMVPIEKLKAIEIRSEERVITYEQPRPGIIPSSKIRAILIGVSTGGPRALRTILPRFPADLPVPIAIALHMPPGYTRPLAEKLNEISRLEVVESADGILMKPGRVILAQAGMHTRLVRRVDQEVEARLSSNDKDYLYIPSVDELFKSGVDAYSGQVLGIVLTGMGNDGTQGSAWIKSKGGSVIAESNSSSVVFGMPRSVIEAGLADHIFALEEIPEAIMEAIL